MKTPHVVIVGGGFGGLSAAKAFTKTKDIKVTLIDKKNYHLFQPLLYQVATAGLSPAEIAYPLRALVANHQNIEVLLGEVKEINKIEKWIKTDSNQLHFDYLILALGSTFTYFNSPQWEPYATALKNIPQATEIRRRVFLAYEKAEREKDPKMQKFHTTFVVVGGGPTGVELAGALGEIACYSLTKDFDHIRPDQTRIILIEAGPKILPTMTDNLQREAIRELEELGVEVRVNAKVSEISEKGIKAGDEFIEAGTVLWAAGVASNPLNKSLGVELDKQGRVIVTKNLSVPGHPYLFVIGDQAHVEGPDGKPLPGLAPVAMQEGRFVAKVIQRIQQGRTPPDTFSYVDKGQMATVGRSRAVAMYKGLEVHGFLAWIMWLIVHIYYLIGFKNRILVLFLWAWTYLTYRRGARLIIENESTFAKPGQT